MHMGMKHNGGMHGLPENMTFVQRGWLSANHLLLTHDDETVLIDSGYVSHAQQTLGLVAHALKGRTLDRLINTHLHSDHCGGNAALQTQYPLFQPDAGVLVSADALWENGFGVVFPEIEGEDGFTGIGQTLDLIESLAPRIVVPGHGEVFTDVEGALTRARSRLESFRAQPAKHASHAAKVLLKFKLLDWQHIADPELMAWCQDCRYLHELHSRFFETLALQDWVMQCMAELVKAGAAQRDGVYWVASANEAQKTKSPSRRDGLFRAVRA